LSAVPPVAPAGPANTVFLGIAWMLASIVCNTLEITLVHYLGPDWPATLQLFWRQGVGLLLLLPFVFANPAGVLHVSRPWIMVLRSVMAMLALLLTIYAYTRLPMATANALTFTRPLWIVLLAALFLGEKVGLWRGGAVLVGFAGVLVMVGPEAGEGDLIAEGAVLLSSLLFAASFISIKSMTGDTRVTTIILYSVLAGLLFSVIPALRQWHAPDTREAILLAGLGFASLGSFACFAKAMKLADASMLGGIDYLRLPFVTLIGLWLFNEKPTPSLLFGAGLIVGATVVVSVRERRIARRAAGG